MKRILTAALMLLLLTGCGKPQSAMDQALSLRQNIGSGCSFDADITADYELTTQNFSLSCTADEKGNVTFTVTSPEPVEGITGRLDSDGGKLTFDDACVQFDPLAEGLLSPVGSPWVLVHTLRGGYITSCESGKNGMTLSADDSYRENALHLNITLNEAGIPTFAEIIWNGRRILSMEIGNFTFL